MEKVKFEKNYFGTFKEPSKDSETIFFCASLKSKIVVSVHCAYANKDIMLSI